MAELYAYLMNRIFRGFVERDAEILRAVEAFDGDLRVDDDALVFTLPALHQFVARCCKENSDRRVDDGRDSYLGFRKALYGNPTNQTLRAWGACVVVECADKDHDLSTYKLLRVEGPVDPRVSKEPPKAVR